MPVYPAYTSFNLKLDATAVARATALVTPVTDAFAAYLAAHPEVPAGGAVDITYVYFGAATVGLNKWKEVALWPSSFPFGRPVEIPSIATFAASTGTGVTTISIRAANTDVARANALIAALGSSPILTNVLGQAVCTGLALLSGVDENQGPFS